jgi:iron complex outermembrane receptor protein
MFHTSSWRRPALVLFLLVALPPSSAAFRTAAAQDITRGAQLRRDLRGTVRDAASGLPLSQVNVRIADAAVSVLTDVDGRFRIVGFLPPTVTVLVRRLGYAPASRRVDLSRGTDSVSFALAPRATTLQGVTVVEDSATRYLAQTQAMSSMSAREVDRARGQTLGETLEELPGVAIIQYGPSIAKPVVRGLHSQRIATVSAGVPMEGQQWGSEHAPEIDAFAANEIEVVRGTGTILYGSGAFGGVVRVSPRPLPTTGGIGGQFSTNAFSNNRQGAASLLLEGQGSPFPRVGALGWRTQVSARRAGDAETPAYFLPNTGFRELHYNAALGVERPWGRSTLSYSHFGSNIGLYLGAHVGNLDDLTRAMANPFTTDAASYALSRPEQRIRHEMVTWQTEVDLPNTARIDVAYGFQYNDRREFDRRGFASTGGRPAFALELYTHTLDVKYRHAPVGPVIGTVGVSGMRQGNLSPGRSFLIPQYRLYSGSVFALEELAVGRLTLTAGARYEYRYQRAYQYGAPVVISPDDRQVYDGVAGSAGATVRLTETWSLGASVARAWRPPNVNERFSQGVHHGTAQYEIGDSSLVPERSLATDVVLRHTGARSRLEISAYRNQVDDFIFLRPRAPVISVRGTYPAYVYAHTNALLRGVELTAQWAPVPWLSLYGNGNIVRGSERASGTALFDMPADRYTASARAFLPDRRWLAAPYVELGATRVERQRRVPPETVYQLPTDGYQLVSFEVGANTLRLGALQLEPSLAVRNLLNVSYRDYLSRYRLFVVEPGRDVVLRLALPVGADRRP